MTTKPFKFEGVPNQTYDVGCDMNPPDFIRSTAQLCMDENQGVQEVIIVGRDGFIRHLVFKQAYAGRK